MAPKQEKKRRQPQPQTTDGSAGRQNRPAKEVKNTAAHAPAIEEDFPRGGADALTAFERRELTEAARREVEQEIAEGKQPKTKKPRLGKKGGADEDAEEDAFFGRQAKQAGAEGEAEGGVAGRLAKHADVLRAKHLAVGTRLWGMVLEVTPRGLVVSLPHGLRGFVPPAAASDVLALLHSGAAGGAAAAKKAAALLAAAGGAVPPLSDLFAVGQFVRCVVTEVAEAGGKEGEKDKRGGRHVRLSLVLRAVQGPLGADGLVEGAALGACVRSVEDHGYTLSFGIKGTSGFLPKRDHEEQFGQGVALQVGGLLDVVVRDGGPGGERRSVRVSCAPDAVAGAVVKGGEGLGLEALLPGALVNVKVRKVLSNGLLVTFLTFFSGTIDTFHLPAGPASNDWRKAYNEGAKLRARVLYVDTAAKRVGLSLLPHLLSLSLPSPVPMLGSVFHSAEVLRVDAAGPGLFLKLAGEGLPEGSAVTAYCHATNALEEQAEREAATAQLGERFKPGTLLPARVIGYRLMDGVAAATVRPSQVTAAVLSYADLAPGMLLTGTVVAAPDKHGEGPLLVSVAEGVRGLVPPIHAAEVAGGRPGKDGRAKAKVKVAVGDKVAVRVMNVDAGGRRLGLTLRKGLLAPKAKPLCGLEQAVPGARFHGVVTGFNERGVFVSFFNHLNGMAPHNELGLEPGQTAAQAFAVGQVVKATVVRAVGGRLRLSLAAKAAAASATEAAGDAAAASAAEPADPLGGLQPGDVAEAVVLEVQQQTLPAAAGAAATSGADGGDAAGSAATTTTTYVCRLEVPGGKGGAVVRGRLEAAHLADHPAAVAAFREAVRPGSRLGKVLVLERLEQQRCLRISRKPCLLAAAPSLPRAFADVREGAVLPGAVASVTHDAVYVRFLGGLTGRAGLSQLSDVFVSDPRVMFAEGQTVRCAVATVDAARQRFTLQLKPSATASSDGAYLLGYLRDMAAVQAMRAEQEAAAAAAGGEAAAPDADPARMFPLGGLAGATVHEVKEYGIVCDMDAHPDMVGLVPSSHTGAAEGGKPPAVGARLRAAVLDVVGHQGLVELSLKPHLTAAAVDEGQAAAAKALKVGTTVEAVVEGVRPGEYLILSLPQNGNLLAYAAVTDYNTPRPEHVPRSFELGQRLSATVAALPSDAPAGRIVVHVPLRRPSGKEAKGGKEGKEGKKERAARVDLTPGSVVEAVVTGVQPDCLDVSLAGGKLRGRVHVTEVVDVDVKALAAAAAAAADGTAAAAAAQRPAKKARKGDKEQAAAAANGTAVGHGGSPLDSFRLQQPVRAVVLGRLQGGDGHRYGTLDLSLRPSRLAVAEKAEPQVPPVSLTDLVPGQQLVCYVLETGEATLWLGAGPAVRGRVSVLDATLDPAVAADLPRAFPPGTPVLARVLAVVPRKHHLDLSLVDPGCGLTHGSVALGATHGSPAAAAPLPPDGALVLGRVTEVAGSGLKVSIGARRSGRVALTDIHDTWVPNALAGIEVGAYVRARMLGHDGERAVLSLRPSRGGAIGGAKAKGGAAPAAAAAKGETAAAAAELVEVDSVEKGATLSGYVKRCDAKGLFLCLDRHRDGRIRLGHLSDGFVEDPAAAFPPGSRLEARLLRKGADGRMDLTLRSEAALAASSAAPRVHSLAELRLGQLVAGRVRRVEKFGVFVEVEGNCRLVGLCHVSNLADRPVKDPGAVFKAKQHVRAVVTKIDEEAGRLSLSMKPSALADAAAAAGEPEEARGAKRRRGKDIDDEMAEAADQEGSSEEGSEGGEGSEDGEGEDGSGGEEESEEEGAGALAADVRVDDVEASSEEEEEEEEGADAAAEGEDEEDGASDSDGEGEALARLPELAGRPKPGITSTGNLDLSAPWGELLLADDPRVGPAAAGAQGEEAEGEGRKGLSKAQKKRLKEAHEREIREAELARLSGASAPTSAADYERLVLASPSSSFVWIKYMAFHISLGDIDAARRLAERALAFINYREEGEKFNVWVAWLNLETAYGTAPSPDEAAMALLRRALQYTDSKKMYLAALGIFDRAGRDELSEQVVKALTKKHGGSAKVWAAALERALKRDDGEASRRLLERALQVLPPRKHVKALVRAALAEFRLGSAERGRGVMEGVLRNHPRRLDLWNVYIDQELKTGDQPRIRALFERATHLPLPPKKMKFLFRRYLEYEKEEGDAAAVEHVKRRAMEFVEAAARG